MSIFWYQNLKVSENQIIKGATATWIYLLFNLKNYLNIAKHVAITVAGILGDN